MTGTGGDDALSDGAQDIRAPIWKITVPDVDTVDTIEVELFTELFCFPEGPVLPMVARVHDQPDRPLMLHRVWDLTRDDDWAEFQALNTTGRITLELVSEKTGRGQPNEITPDGDKLARRRDLAERCLAKKPPNLTRTAEEAYREIMTPNFDGGRYFEGWDEVEKRLAVKSPAPVSTIPQSEAISSQSPTDEVAKANGPESFLRQTGKDFLMFLLALGLIALDFGFIVLVAHFEPQITGWVAWPLIAVAGLVLFVLLLPLAVLSGRAFLWGMLRRLFS